MKLHNTLFRLCGLIVCLLGLAVFFVAHDFAHSLVMNWPVWTAVPVILLIWSVATLILVAGFMAMVNGIGEDHD